MGYEKRFVSEAVHDQCTVVEPIQYTSTMSQNPSRTGLAADIGGTFTDVVLERHNRFFSAKVPTDAQRPERGVLAGIDIVLREASVAPAEVDIFIHGTTLATNALIERKGVQTALITTEGFRDSLEIAYESRFDQYDLLLEKPRPLIPRDLRFPISERMDAKGRVLRELDRSAVAALAPEFELKGIEAVAVGLLHSYANPTHEQAVREILRGAGCQAEISLSCEICPEVREYERLMTTACNAYVQPIMARYLRALESEMREGGFGCPFFMMTSGGAMTTLDVAIRHPIRLVESGPSGGAVLASRIAAGAGERRVVAFDMGGTTAKICLIEDYEPKTARNFEIARSARFQKGSGMPVRIPVVEMIEIGAGGGSIARVDEMQRLTVGPQSAGAVPGAACYGKGGSQATVTDANVVLGRIDPDKFAEGKLQLDVTAAERAVQDKVAAVLSISASEAAFGITEMVEENMASAARIHSVEHGSDLSKFTLIAFGGGGALHGGQLAEKLGIDRMIIPAHSGVGSAVGFLWAPIAYEIVQSRYMTLHGFEVAAANQVIAQISSEARSIVASGAPGVDLIETRTAYMRYVGQGHEVQVPLPGRVLESSDVEGLRAAYDSLYARLYGRVVPARDIEILSWSIVVSTPVLQPTAERDVSEPHTPQPASHRSVFLPATQRYSRIPVYWRPDLAAGASFQGPVLVAEPQTTTFVTPAFSARIDRSANLILERIR
jgi:N-methylhydantoinase A